MTKYDSQPSSICQQYLFTARHTVAELKACLLLPSSHDIKWSKCLPCEAPRVALWLVVSLWSSTVLQHSRLLWVQAGRMMMCGHMWRRTKVFLRGRLWFTVHISPPDHHYPWGMSKLISARVWMSSVPASYMIIVSPTAVWRLSLAAAALTKRI